MTTLADAILAVAQELGEVFRGSAETGSSATLLIDTKLAAKPSVLINGTLMVLSGTHIGKTRIILNHDGTGVTFDTLGSTLTAGDKYAALTGNWPRRLLIQGINAALEDIGDFTFYDETLDTVAGQAEYDIPAAVQGKVAAVRLGKSTTAPYDWYEVRHVDARNDGHLVFHDGYEPVYSGYPIQLAYNTRHPYIESDTDVIRYGVQLARLKWEALVHIYRARFSTGTPGGDNPLVTLLNEAKDNAKAAPSHMVFAEQKLPNLAEW